MKRLMMTASMLAAATVAQVAHADSSALKLQAIDAVVEQHDRALQACGRSLAKKGDVVAVMVAVTIDQNGRVVDAEAKAQGVAGRCIERTVKKMQFPSSGLYTQLAYPILINPR